MCMRGIKEDCHFLSEKCECNKNVQKVNFCTTVEIYMFAFSEQTSLATCTNICIPDSEIQRQQSQI